jgi:small subunit ribosomal protein S6
MKRPYELMVVFDGSLSEEVLQKEQKQIEDLISQHAEFEKVEVLGKKTLAYPIRKKRSGYYCLYLFSGIGDLVPVFDKQIKLNEAILRHLTVVRDLKNEVARQNLALRRERAAAEGEPPPMDPDNGGRRDRFRDRDAG